MKTGPISDRQGDLIADAINQRSKSGDPCPNCGKEPSHVVHYVVPLPIQLPAAGRQAQMLPAAMTVCSQCGFVRFFSTRELGLEDMIPEGSEDEDNG